MLLKFGPGFGKIGSKMPAAAFFARQRTTSDQKGDCLDVPQFDLPCRVAHLMPLHRFECTHRFPQPCCVA